MQPPTSLWGTVQRHLHFDLYGVENYIAAQILNQEILGTSNSTFHTQMQSTCFAGGSQQELLFLLYPSGNEGWYFNRNFLQIADSGLR